MGRALVLNASFEPLCVVPSRRAVILVLAEKAELVHDSGDALHSERLTIPVPSVVRLRSYVAVPFHRRVAVSRRAVMARDRHSCQYCGAHADSIDHVVPRSRGGDHAWDNVVAACRACNVRKRDRLLGETTMRLRTRPRAPVGAGWLILAAGSVRDEWHAYLQVDFHDDDLPAAAAG
jgi:5-methylcytosine-specific restriction endonuclease McrA